MTQKLKLMGTGTSSKNADQMAAGTVTRTLTATGSTSQANSYGIADDVSEFTVCGSGAGCRLPATGSLAGEGPTPGDMFFIGNCQGSNALLIYPPTGGTCNGLAANTSVSCNASYSAIAIYLGGTIGDYLIVLGP